MTSASGNAGAPARPLAELTAGFAAVPADVMVSDVTLDSRTATPGALFLACRGRTQHGLKFALEAVSRGARAVLYERDGADGGAELDLPAGIFAAAVPSLSERVGLIADRFFGAPSAQLTVAGITGTNGKTTCAWLLAQALAVSGRPAAYIGTLGFGAPPRLTPTLHTTSDAVSIQRQLAQLRTLGAECVSMEVSSHALDQGRVDAVRFHTAAFTNLTRDHLDYHGTMEAYGAAKARLFDWDRLAHRVINVDDAFGARLAEAPSSAPLTVTMRAARSGPLPRGAQFVRARRVTPNTSGLDIEVESSWGALRLAMRLVGDFNVDNVLTVLAVLLTWSIPPEEAARALAGSRAASGRMEMFGGSGASPLAIVDYAHTPDALANALRAARRHTRGKLRLVFGCGGDRDAGKRPLMGQIAAELADEIIVTDDNPRTEDPRRIVADIVGGIGRRTPPVIEHDRALAIHLALARSGPGDVVLIAGKGHEDYQIVGAERRPFRDQAVVVAELAGKVRMKRTLAEFARACGGELSGPDAPFTDVVSDSRALERGQLFIALKGPRFNGNEFVGAAHERGAAGALVDARQPAPLPQILVPDTQAALERAGGSWRAAFRGPLIGVAGSNGKTTTKEMTASILAQAGTCLATRGNLNNHIGVPLTLLRLTPTHRFAVVEMGTNHPGEVAALVDIARPTIGLITNAGAEHLEGFGSLEGVARAEGEMVAGLPKGATAVVNADDEFAPLWRSLTAARVVTFSVRRAADYRASDVHAEVGSEGFSTRFRLQAPGGSIAIRLAVGGAHNVANALAAAAAAGSAGASLEQIAAGLAAVRAVSGRLQFRRAKSSAWLIDDSYNANPSSVRAAIEVLSGVTGRKWMVLGDMAELGEHAAALHAEIGEFARAKGLERLFATGALAARAVKSFGAGGEWFKDAAALTAALTAALGAGGADVRLLIKGSRMNRLERVVEALAADAAPARDGH